MQTNIERITPEMANKILEKNTANRKVRVSWVDTLAGILRRGEWVVTHQGIALDKNGNLIDGQHRLLAIRKTGIAANVMISRDVDPAAYLATDCGLSRTISDRTNIDKRIAEPLRFLASFITTSKPTAQEVLVVYDTGVGSIISRLVDYCGTARKVVSSAPIKCAAAIAIMNGENEAYVFSQYRALVLSDFDVMSQPAKLLYRQKDAGLINHSKQRELFAKALKVFDYSRKDLAKLSANENEVLAAVELARATLRNRLEAAA